MTRRRDGGSLATHWGRRRIPMGICMLTCRGIRFTTAAPYGLLAALPSNLRFAPVVATDRRVLAVRPAARRHQNNSCGPFNIGSLAPQGTVHLSSATPGSNQPSGTAGNVQLVATPNTGDPNSWYVNPGSGQMRSSAWTGTLHSIHCLIGRSPHMPGVNPHCTLPSRGRPPAFVGAPLTWWLLEWRRLLIRRLVMHEAGLFFDVIDAE